MKRFAILLFVLCLSRISFAADAPLERHKESRRGGFEVEAEVVSFYRYLLANSADVKGQFDRLASQAPSFGDTHFGIDEPYAVEWFPRLDRFRAGEKFSWDSHFLVFQPLTLGRPGQQDREATIVSEFHVVHEGKKHSASRSNEKIDHSEITLTFLGFRNIALSPASD
jgi:hypothetical protein